MNQQFEDNEIDLFELFQTLWDSKWLIAGFTLVATLFAYSYTQVVQAKFKVSVPYTLNLYSVTALQNCQGNLGCAQAETEKNFFALLESAWTKDKRSSVISLETTRPQQLDDYKNYFEKINRTVTSEISTQASTEISIIEADFNSSLSGTETVASNMLNAKRILRSIDDGKTAISFGSISVTKTSPKTALVLVLSVFLGGLIGVFFVLIRNAYRSHKKSLETV
jgi:capsular polysaccharide biosynthesis protein